MIDFDTYIKMGEPGGKESRGVENRDWVAGC